MFPKHARSVGGEISNIKNEMQACAILCLELKGGVGCLLINVTHDMDNKA